MHKLIIEDDEGKTVVVPLIRDEITIGRQEGNTVRLTEQNISRRHARLIRESGVLSVEDVGSYNGVTVNGARIKQKQVLHDGDEIAIGDYKFGVKIDGVDKTLGYDAAIPFQSSAPPTASPPRVVAPSAAAPEAARGSALSPQAAGSQQAPASPPVPQEEMDGAPTIPVRTLADQERETAATAPLVGKLVVISSNFSGHEFLLDRPSLVVGRTPENDVVLNHKSISRHHAKIIRDGNHFVIVDLESANGVRVNGSTEDRAQLDHGDTIELGHVRMRFLSGANADSAAAFEGMARSKKPMIIAAAAVAAIGIVAIAIASGGKDEDGGPEKGKGSGTAAAQTAGPAPPAIKPLPQKSGPELLAEARQAFDQEKWDVALTTLRKAAELDPTSAPVSELAARVEAERVGAEKLAVLKTEAAAGNLETARAAAGAIPDASRFKVQAAALVTEAQSNYVAAHLQTAEEQRTGGACDAAKAEVALVLAVDPGNTTAKEIISLCKPAPRAAVAARRAAAPEPRAAARQPTAVADVPAVRPRPPVARPAARPEAPAVAAEPEPAGDPDEFLRKATDAWMRGQYAAAIESSRSALKIRPGLMRAYQIMAVCSCALRDEGGAGRAYEKLDAKNRGMVKTLCQKNGIALE